jgi:hypothetical protein
MAIERNLSPFNVFYDGLQKFFGNDLLSHVVTPLLIVEPITNTLLVNAISEVGCDCEQPHWRRHEQQEKCDLHNVSLMLVVMCVALKASRRSMR